MFVVKIPLVVLRITKIPQGLETIGFEIGVTIRPNSL